MIPMLKARHNRHIVGLKHVEAGRKDIRQLAFMDEHRNLAFAHSQLGPVFDFMPLALKAINQCVTGVVRPLNDINELT